MLLAGPYSLPLIPATRPCTLKARLHGCMPCGCHLKVGGGVLQEQAGAAQSVREHMARLLPALSCLLVCGRLHVSKQNRFLKRLEGVGFALMSCACLTRYNEQCKMALPTAGSTRWQHSRIQTSHAPESVARYHMEQNGLDFWVSG